MDHTNGTPSGAIEEILSKKRDLIRLVIIATIIAFAVGALSSLLASQTTVPESIVVVLSMLLLTASMFMLAREFVGSLRFEDVLGAVVFLNLNGNEILRVEDYRFSESLCKTLTAVKAESKAIYADWESDPLVKKSATKTKAPRAGDVPKYFSVVKVTVSDDENKPPTSVRLLEEAANFVLLNELSYHLSAYFHNNDNESVHELNREDIPDFLLKNRVLNLLSTPIEQRDIFLKAFPRSGTDPKGVIYSVYGSDGSVYSRFDLVLPHGSFVRASNDGGVTIETKRISLTMRSKYTGTMAVPSRRFVEQYVGYPYRAVSPLNMTIYLSGRVKAWSLFTSSGWQYYRWLDSFRQRARLSFDFEAFLDSIHWRAVETFVHTFRRSSVAEKRASKDSGESRPDSSSTEPSTAPNP